MLSRRNLLKAFALVPAAALVPNVALGEPIVQQPPLTFKGVPIVFDDPADYENRMYFVRLPA